MKRLNVNGRTDRKQGYLLPGSRLPIARSSALLERGIKLCLLSVNPDNENAVIEKNRAFLHKGGTFLSIFPSSRRALHGVKLPVMKRGASGNFIETSSPLLGED